MERRHSSPVLNEYSQAPKEPIFFTANWMTLLSALKEIPEFRRQDLGDAVTGFAKLLQQDAADAGKLKQCFQEIVILLENRVGTARIKANTNLRVELSMMATALGNPPEELTDMNRQLIASASRRFADWAGQQADQ